MAKFKIILLCLLLSSGALAQKTKPSVKPTGMFIMEGSGCAGFNFISDTAVNFINEIGCSTWELRAKWIDNKTFTLVEKERKSEGCPPRVMVCRVISYDGKVLKLKEFWTGWGNLKDEITTYTKK
jgi:hypothetical protein